MALKATGDPLALFSPPVAGWFRQAFGAPTAPQGQGWPVIARGEHALVLAPTGSGKTLTAFLWSLDVLFRDLSETPEPERRARGSRGPKGAVADEIERRRAAYRPGVRVLYVSPLKALNNDVERNLRVPLAGIRGQALRADLPLPALRVAVRTGDTPSHERQGMVRRPPHILITTPESLYLMLTAERSQGMFATTHTVIVDEIHTLVGTKRGAHLALSLERLERLTHGGAPRPGRARLQRIGLSATVRPLEEAARFLGGQDAGAGFVPRPVTVVDAPYRKSLDVRVVSVVDGFRDVPGNSIWTAVVPAVTHLIDRHHTTLVFCNNRRLAERTADRLNERRLLEKVAPSAPGGPGADGENGKDGARFKPRRGATLGADVGMFATGVDRSLLEAAGLQPIRAHHGSMSKAARLEMEGALKAGTLPALVATSSLELGIDIGEVDLVVHLQSPKSVSSGLQRVGRSGHLVGQTSVGRIFATHAEDVMEAAAVAWGMRYGEIEETHTPENPLDVLAQHVVAAVGAEDWDYDDLYALVRGAYPFRHLSPAAFDGVLEMLAGKYPEIVSRALQPRISWDRVHNRLAALPGTRFLAVGSGGTIPDRGTYSMVLADRRTKVGELDEEFVFESRAGDTFLLGSQVWRVTDITDDRVVAEPAPGEIPRMPFWRGDQPWRPYDLGKRIGAFRRRVVDLLAALDATDVEQIRQLTEDDLAGLAGPVATDVREADPHLPAGRRQVPGFPEGAERGEPARALLRFLHGECGLDRNSIVQVVTYAAGQLGESGELATDRSIVVETFEDALGDPRMVVHSPFGGRVNGPWGIALAHAIRERLGMEPQVVTGDDGILLRFGDTAETADTAGAGEGGRAVRSVGEGRGQAGPAGVVAALTSAEARERLLAELPRSAVFGAQFRMNAARALLLPRGQGGKRTPLWLSRLRAKDLLQAVQRFDDFPILLETYRDCLRDVMDLEGLTEVLDRIQRGEIRVTVHEAEFPSPVARGLDYRMAMQYVYEHDAPRGEKQLAALSLNRSLLADLLRDGSLAELLKPAAVAEVTARLARTAPSGRARSAEELAQILYDLGDLSDSEIATRSAGEWTQDLAAAGRLVSRELGGEQRWIHAERLADYDALLDDPLPALRRWLTHAGPAPAGDLARRYGLTEARVEGELRRLGDDVVAGRFTPGAGEQWIDRRTLEEMHRRTLTLLRKEVQPVPLAAYAEFLCRWQGVWPPAVRGEGGVSRVLQQLRGMALPGVSWERDVLPARLPDFDPAALADRCQSGEVMWVAEGGRDARRARVRFFFRGEGDLFLERRPDAAVLEALGDPARAIYDFLTEEGAALLIDITDGTGLPRAQAQGALVELVLAGLATNDSLAALRAVLAYEGGQDARPQRRSSLELDLAARLSHLPQRQTAGRLRDARRRAREIASRTAQPDGIRGLSATGPVTGWIGRWSLVHRAGLLGKPLDESERALRQTRQLLSRWGVVTKACLEREAATLRWEALLPVLGALETRGEVRRGYFVEGLPGLQYALPDVVEGLREANAESVNTQGVNTHGVNTQDEDSSGETGTPVVLSAADPAQLYGTDIFGGSLRFQRLPSTAVALVHGQPVAALEDGGTGAIADAGHPALVPALRALGRWWGARLRGTARLKVERWGDGPVLDGDGATWLEGAGFVRDGDAMLWIRDQRN